MERLPRGRRAAEWLATSLLSADDAERLLADLADEHGRYGRSERWYWRQLIASIFIMKRSAWGRTGRERDAERPLSGLLGDARYATRALIRTPSYTLAAVATLAVGIGANTAIFSVVDAVLLEPLPYDHPERILRGWAHRDDGTLPDFSFRVVEMEAFREQRDVFEAVGGEFPVSLTALIPEHEPLQVEGRRVNGAYFDVFGVRPALGRMFTAEEIVAGDAAVAVVSHGFWTTALSGEASVVGSGLELNGRSFTVLGVLPEDYRHVGGGDVDVFIPFSLGTSGWVARWLDVYVRALPGVRASVVEDRLNAVMTGIGSDDRRSAGWHATVEGLHEMVVGDVRTVLVATFGVVTLVLLIACLNVANLTLARGSARRGEIAIRTALGAGRGRIVRQLVVEGLGLAVVGGVVGIALAAVVHSALIAVAPPSIPRVAEASLDTATLAFALVISLGTVVVFGLAPAVGAARKGLDHLGQRGVSSRVGRGARSALVVSQVALTLVLLVGSGLMVKTFQNLRNEELGFTRTGALAFRTVLPSARYPTAADTEAFYRDLREALGALPGVLAVGGASDLPISGEGAVASVTTEERVAAGREDAMNVLQRRATIGYFDALGTPILEGRGFGDEDRADGESVAVLSESLARTLFPAGSAVGRKVGWGSNPSEEDWMTVVGVVADVRYEHVDRAPRPQIYQAHQQSAIRELAMVVRSERTVASVVDEARAVLGDLDAQVPMYEIQSLSGLVDRTLAGRRFTAAAFALFALAALLLTVAGVYGLLAYLVGDRSAEVGVRMALGARRHDVTRMVVWSGMRLVLIGLAVGGPAAWAVGRLFQALLYGVSPQDPGTYASVALLVSLVAVVACWVPARRAATVDPMSVLRAE